jgi:hypothetical protein
MVNSLSIASRVCGQEIEIQDFARGGKEILMSDRARRLLDSVVGPLHRVGVPSRGAAVVGVAGDHEENEVKGLGPQKG